MIQFKWRTVSCHVRFVDDEVYGYGTYFMLITDLIRETYAPTNDVV